MQVQCRSGCFLHILFLFTLCISIYFSTLSNDWHLDDSANILSNTPLHITDIHPSSLIQTFYAHPVEPDKLFRPVANFSFGINWFFGKNQIYSYHLVNITIHCLTAITLYLSCLLLLQSPALAPRELRHQSTIALLAALLWVSAPIHTQAVTYIVQRMAQLAALFSVSAILFFLLARQTTTNSKRFAFSACFLCSALLAMGSKENSILLLFSIPLIEFIFFSQKRIRRFSAKIDKIWLLVILLIVLTAVGFILSQYSTRYDHRNFTMIERLLTEPRILLFYLSQIFFPSAAKLSIEHDIVLSTSLFSLWTTLPAIIICSGLIIFSFCRVHSNPLLSFSILFFFLNHLVESTIIPLELIFEHRNYLPSLFLFLPIAALVVTPISQTARINKLAKLVLSVGCSIFLIISGLATHERNKAWASEQTLWQDAVAKAPKSGRAKINLAKTYIEQNRHKEALQLCEQAEQLSGATRNKLIPISLNSKSAIAYKEGNFDAAVTYLQEALALRNDYNEAAYKLIALLIELTRYEEALVLASKRYKETGDSDLLLIKASLLLRLNKPSESLETYHAALLIFPTSPLIAAGQGKAMSMLGYNRQADQILGFAVAARQPGSLFLRIENNLDGGDHEQASRILKQLSQTVPLNILLQELETPQTGVSQVPYDHTLLKKKLVEIIQDDKLRSS